MLGEWIFHLREDEFDVNGLKNVKELASFDQSVLWPKIAICKESWSKPEALRTFLFSICLLRAPVEIVRSDPVNYMNGKEILT